MAERNWHEIEGSNRIKAYDYDLPSYTFYLKFQPNKKDGECDAFAYANVSPRMVDDFLASPSKGRWLAQEIDAHKNDYPYQRVGKEPANEPVA